MSFKDVTRAWVTALLRIRERMGGPTDLQLAYERGDATVSPELAEELLVSLAQDMARGNTTTYPRLPTGTEAKAHAMFFPAGGERCFGWWVLVGPDGIPGVHLLGSFTNLTGRHVYAIDLATRRQIQLPEGITLAVPIKVLP